MTDAAEPLTTIRTSFERVAQSSAGLPQYESARALVSVEETFPGTMQPDEVAAIIANQFVHAKSAAFQQLGLGFEQDADGVLRETFGDVVVVESAPTQAGAARQVAPQRAALAPPAPAPRPAAPRAPQPNAGRSSAPPRRPATSARGARSSDADDQYWVELMESPDRWEDARDSKTNPKAPDFKSLDHKEGRFSKGLWLDRAPDWFVDPWA